MTACDSHVGQAGPGDQGSPGHQPECGCGSGAGDAVLVIRFRPGRNFHPGMSTRRRRVAESLLAGLFGRRPPPLP
jgi:hypothetical protein